KGRKVFVAGRLQTRNWQAADGTERTTVEIVIDNMIVLDSKRKDGQGYAQGDGDYADEQAAASSPPQGDDVPYDDLEQGEAAAEEKAKPAQGKSAKPPVKKAQPKADDTKDEEVNPDDIPF
ncbi:TPA: hypothetical protein DEB02_00500, partial [Candidatus Beckwithbacteria bacterium]|nr:hypothetical protein [Candidatus Beckwithbacteria bacterium]